MDDELTQIIDDLYTKVEELTQENEHTLAGYILNIVETVERGGDLKAVLRLIAKDR